MLSPDNEQGLLLFSLFDQAGAALDNPRRVIWKRLADKAAANPLWSYLPKAGLSDREATFQVQALIATPDALSAPQQQAVHSLFVAARQMLLAAYHQQRQVGDE
jgi:hypothetical protein